MAFQVGFIGVGGIAGGHLANASGREDTEVVAVCDINEERASEVATQYDASPYTNYVEMLDAEQIDAAYVCVPPFAHGRIELELARRGVPFCVEKPVNLDLTTGAEVAHAVADEGLVTSVGYQVRYAPQVDRAAEFLSSHRTTLLEGWFVGGMPPSPWWRQKAKSGGQAVEQTTHIFDLARVLCGEVEEVRAYGSTGTMSDVEDYDIEDATVALLKFESGAVGHVCSACVLTDGGDPHVGLRMDGRSFTVKLTYGSLSLHSEEGEEENDYPDALGQAGSKLDGGFLDAAENGDPEAVRCDYEDGLRSAALSLAVNISMVRDEAVQPAELLRSAGL